MILCHMKSSRVGGRVYYRSWAEATSMTLVDFFFPPNTQQVHDGYLTGIYTRGKEKKEKTVTSIDF
jgi:hypothetical protein